jgi:hypothetical protein
VVEVLDFGNTLDNAIVKLLGFPTFDPGPDCGPRIKAFHQEVYDMTVGTHEANRNQRFAAGETATDPANAGA